MFKWQALNIKLMSVLIWRQLLLFYWPILKEFVKWASNSFQKSKDNLWKTSRNRSHYLRKVKRYKLSSLANKPLSTGNHLQIHLQMRIKITIALDKNWEKSMSRTEKEPNSRMNKGKLLKSNTLVSWRKPNRTASIRTSRG